MTNIEWSETKERQPEIKTIDDYCIEHEISKQQLAEDVGLIAFIEHQALEGLHDFLAHDQKREHGGVLLGLPFYDPNSNRHFIDIKVAIPALDTEGTPVHLQFLPKTWDYISGIIEESFPDLMILGWYHSHPGLGVFMSGTDQATQRAFYNHPWNVAIVVDPIKRKTGWFAGSECTPMDINQVILYQEVSIGAEEETIEEYGKKPEYRKPKTSDIRRLNWLLPFASIFLISLVILAVNFLRKQIQN